jgi:hypothetical protein
MGIFDKTESSYIEEKFVEAELKPQIGQVVKVREHASPTDFNNFECDVLVRGKTQQRRGVLLATPAAETVYVPSVGDTVLVQTIAGRGERAVITHVLHTAETRAPLGEEGIIRQKKGNLYYEVHPDGDWIRMAYKNADDAVGGSADARIEIDDTGSDPVINITTSGGDINVASDSGSIKLGDPNGSFQDVARKGDSVQVNPLSGSGSITGGSSDVQSS